MNIGRELRRWIVVPTPITLPSSPAPSEPIREPAREPAPAGREPVLVPVRWGEN